MISLRYQRRLGHLLKVCLKLTLIIVLAWAIARIFWILVAQEFAVADASGIKTPRFGSRGADINVSTSDTSLLVEKNFFRQIGAAQDAGEIPKTRLNLKLKGVRAGGIDVEGMAIIRTPDNKDKSYAVGSEIVAGVVLAQVMSDRVILSKNGTDEVLIMDGASSIFNRQPTPEVKELKAPTPSVQDTIDLPSRIISAIAFDNNSNGGGIIVMARDPNRDDLSAYSIQSGDIITSINNQPTDAVKPQDFFAAFMSGRTFTVAIERDGERQVLQMRRKKEN